VRQRPRSQRTAVLAGQLRRDLFEALEIVVGAEPRGGWPRGSPTIVMPRRLPMILPASRPPAYLLKVPPWAARWAVSTSCCLTTGRCKRGWATHREGLLPGSD
jgi:hypothetical protein